MERGRYTSNLDDDRNGHFRDYDDLDDDCHSYHKRNRRYETDIERDRTVDLLKSETQKTEETESEKPKRDEVEQEDYQEKIKKKKKKKSRRRRQAILEKYKNQPSQKDQATQSGDNGEVHADQYTEKPVAGDSVVPEPIDGPTSGADVHVDEPTFSSGKSPSRGGYNVEEKASGAGFSNGFFFSVFNRGVREASEEA